MCAVMGRPELKTMRSGKKPEVGDIGTMRAGSEEGALHDAPLGHVCHLEPLEDSGLTDSESESRVLSCPGHWPGSLLSDVATEDKTANQSRDPGESH